MDEKDLIEQVQVEAMIPIEDMENETLELVEQCERLKYMKFREVRKHAKMHAQLKQLQKVYAKITEDYGHTHNEKRKAKWEM